MSISPTLFSLLFAGYHNAERACGYNQVEILIIVIGPYTPPPPHLQS